MRALLLCRAFTASQVARSKRPLHDRDVTTAGCAWIIVLARELIRGFWCWHGVRGPQIGRKCSGARSIVAIPHLRKPDCYEPVLVRRGHMKATRKPRAGLCVRARSKPTQLPSHGGSRGCACAQSMRRGHLREHSFWLYFGVLARHLDLGRSPEF